MINLMVKELYNVVRISTNNSKPWEILANKVKELNQDVMFDFKGIDVVDPWKNQVFKELILDERVHLRVYNMGKLVSFVNAASIMDAKKVGRVENIVSIVETPSSKDAEDKRIDRMAENLMKHFIVEEGTACIEVFKTVTQINNEYTINSIVRAIENYIGEHPDCKNVAVKLGKMDVSKSPCQKLARAIIAFDNKGITVDVYSDNAEVYTTVKLYIHQESTADFNVEQRLEAFKSLITIGTAGILVQYKHSKNTDSFGRYGKGVPNSSKVAVFLGMTNHKGKVCAVFRVYDNSTFYTKAHWYLENDEENLVKLRSSMVYTPLDSIGLENKFLGSKYHFMLPIQKSASETITMYSIRNGSVTGRKVTIPERIKAVFDDFGIKYDKDKLSYAIAETRKYVNVD